MPAWAIAAVIISSTWAYVASKALEFLLAKNRAADISAVAAQLAVTQHECESLGGEVTRMKDRFARLELKRA